MFIWIHIELIRKTTLKKKKTLLTLKKAEKREKNQRTDGTNRKLVARW